MKPENREKALRESSTEVVKRVRSFWTALKPSRLNTRFMEEMSGRIGDLWLMISLT